MILPCRQPVSAPLSISRIPLNGYDVLKNNREKLEGNILVFLFSSGKSRSRKKKMEDPFGSGKLPSEICAYLLAFLSPYHALRWSCVSRQVLLRKHKEIIFCDLSLID